MIFSANVTKSLLENLIFCTVQYLNFNASQSPNKPYRAVGEINVIRISKRSPKNVPLLLFIKLAQL